MLGEHCGHHLKSSSHRFEGCINCCGRVLRDHPKAWTRQSLLWVRGRDRKVPLAESGYGYAVKLPIPALHPLATQYSVSYICLAESCPHETGCISIATQWAFFRHPCAPKTCISPRVFTLPLHPCTLEPEIMRAVLQPTSVFYSSILGSYVACLEK